jgi:hypothetical protein
VNVHAHFVNGRLDGTTFSSDSSNPKYAALAKLIYAASDSFRKGGRIRWNEQAIRAARQEDVVDMLSLFLDYFVLKSSCAEHEIHAWLYHIPAVG